MTVTSTMRSLALKRFWTYGNARHLRGKPEAQLVALYLLTGPHCQTVGWFYCPVVYIVHDTGLSDAVVRQALRLLDGEEKLIHHDAGIDHIRFREEMFR